MATHILPLDLNDDAIRDEFETHQHVYWKGHCIAFAAAVHRITGWEIITIDTKESLLAHCGVRAPDGVIWDGRGPVTPEQFIESHINVVPEHFRVPTWEELRAAWPPIGLPTTERIVSQMYPDLPHLPTSDRSRTVAFMDEVEAMSRRHDAWIVANPTSPLRGSEGHVASAMHCWPVIGEEFDEIAGYRMAFNNGVTTFDRALRSEMPRGPSHAPRWVERFITELTMLSTAHKLWIRANIPTAWPRLERLNATGRSNAHYAMQQGLNAGGFLVNVA